MSQYFARDYSLLRIFIVLLQVILPLRKQGNLF